MSSTAAIVEATQAVTLVHTSRVTGFLHTEAFLALCQLVLPVVDKMGTLAFSLVKKDIHGRITRLADKAATDPARYENIFTIAQDELQAGTAHDWSSCTRSLLWLKRAMEFMVAVVKATVREPKKSLSQVVSETYRSTLMHTHPHSDVLRAALELAFKFVTSRKRFIRHIGPGMTQEVTEKKMKELVAGFEPILQDVHTFLVEVGLEQ